jgi:hypothetical protein
MKQQNGTHLREPFCFYVMGMDELEEHKKVMHNKRRAFVVVTR